MAVKTQKAKSEETSKELSQKTKSLDISAMPAKRIEVMSVSIINFSFQDYNLAAMI